MTTMRSCRLGLIVAVLAVLTGCARGPSPNDAEHAGTAPNGGSLTGPGAGAATVVVSGSVGDGPVVEAELVLTDAVGRMVGSARSSGTADYRLELRADSRFPVLVTAAGGTDLVTDRALDFPLVGVILDARKPTVNISPLTTLAVSAAQCSNAGLTEAGLSAAWDRIYERQSFGLDDRVVVDPMGDQVTAVNVATLVLANEALGEAVRRTMDALERAGRPVAGAEIVRQVGCDLIGASGTGAVDLRVIASFKAAELAVRAEALAGRLEVDGYDATDRMDASIRTIRPDAEVESVARLPVPESARVQARDLVTLWLGAEDDPRLLALASILQSTPVEALSAAVDAHLTAGFSAHVQALPLDVALRPLHEIEVLQGAVAGQQDRPAPLVALAASSTRISRGGSVTVTWSARDADICHASGGWSGALPTTGARLFDALQQSARYELTCAGAGGLGQRAIAVEVVEPTSAPVVPPAPDPVPDSPSEPIPAPSSPTAPAPAPPPVSPPPPQPTVSLQAAAGTVSQGQSATLSWSSTNASACSASGGWSGARATSGSASVGPLQSGATFSLTCTGAGGSAVAMISVAVNGRVTLRWQAPTQAEDGSPLGGLSGYRIYYGQFSRNYTDVLNIDVNQGSEYSLMLPSGEYYIAMTAIGLGGEESAYSNEVLRIVQ